MPNCGSFLQLLILISARSDFPLVFKAWRKTFDVFFLVLMVHPATADFDKKPLLFSDVQYCGEGASFQILF